jgi:hypothetical protein
MSEQFDLETSINWSLFTEEEKGLIKACYQNGDFYNLACLPGVEINTPKKEAEIEKIVMELMPIGSDDSESDVRKKIDAFWQTEEEMTPAKEAEFQKMIDDEKAAKKKQAKKEKEKTKKEKEEEKEVVEEEPKSEEIKESKPKGRPKKNKEIK